MIKTFLFLLVWIVCCFLAAVSFSESGVLQWILRLMFPLFGLPCAYLYAKAIFPIWLRLASPPLKLPFYPIIGCGVLGFAIYISYIAIQNANDPELPFGLWAAAAGAYLAAAYPFFVFYYIRAEENREIDKLTTGTLAGVGQLERQDFFKTGALFLGVKDKRAVFLPRFESNIITFGGPGSGKTTGTVVPNLMHWPGSVFCLDPKGELAAQTAEYRKSIGQEVIYLNPTGELKLPNTPLNPLTSLLDAHEQTLNPAAPLHQRYREVPEACAFAMIIVPEPPGTDGDKNKWVRDGARNILVCSLLFLVVFKPDKCNLLFLRERVSDYDALVRLLSLRTNRDFRQALNGELLARADSMNSLMSNPEQFASCHSELLSALEVYSRHGHMALSVAGTATFRIRSLVQRPTTIYLIPPREAAQREAYRPWMQLIISSALAALVQHGTNEPGKQILFMLEEFGNIGKIPNMDKVLNLYRAYGLRAWLILQHRSQIYATYKKEDAESIEDACATIQVLTLNHEHAKILSEKIGTVGITKGGVSGGGGGSHTGTRAVNYEKRPLLEPAEIEALNGKNQCLIITDATTPRVVTILEKCPYWRVDKWAGKVAPNPVEGRSPPSVPASQMVRVS